MEAIGLWDFSPNPSDVDEMPFRKGDHLYVINMDDKDWYKAVSGQKCGFIPANHIRMDPPEWFNYNLTRVQAENLLLEKDIMGAFIHEDGNFVIRKSESDPNGIGFSLSVKHEGTVQHFKILKDSENKFYIWTTSADSINELVNKYHKENVSGDPRKKIILMDMKPPEYFEAMFNFNPANDEEIELKKGDIVKLISKPDENWWTGDINGVKGFFPKTYVKEYVKP